jgi:hypothetical protein
MQTLTNRMEGNVAVNGIHWNEGLSAFLKIHDGYEEEY